MDLSLNDFKGRVGLGTRPNRYLVDMSIPNSSYTMKAEVSALSLPDSTVPAIQIPFRGRILKVPGDRRYGSWAFTVYDTIEEGNLWRELHAWSERINEHVSNKTPFEYEDGNTPDTAVWTIEHYDLNGEGNPLKKVQLINCWPSSIGSFDLATGMMDTLAQFSVQIEYEYFKIL